MNLGFCIFRLFQWIAVISPDVWGQVNQRHLFEGRKFQDCFSGRSFVISIFCMSDGAFLPGGSGLVQCAFVQVFSKCLDRTCHSWSIVSFFGYLSGQSNFFLATEMATFITLLRLRFLESRLVCFGFCCCFFRFLNWELQENTEIISGYIGLVIFFLILRICEQKSNEK